jgi:hypothetical protein
MRAIGWMSGSGVAGKNIQKIAKERSDTGGGQKGKRRISCHPSSKKFLIIKGEKEIPALDNQGRDFIFKA